MRIKTLADFYLHKLQDMHSCESQIMRALPKMAIAATNTKLREAFNQHLDQTTEHLERLNTILSELDKDPGRTVCAAAAGLIKEGSELIEADADEEVRDAALICAAQTIEHYEIASYGCLRTYATLLGRDSDAKILERTLNEEKTCDQSLTELAMSVINPVAAT